MPIYLEISRLHHCVTIVARGKISPDEVAGTAQQLFDAAVPDFAKIVDVAGATAEVSPEQVQRIATFLSGGPDSKRGPVAFLINPDRGDFARAFAATQGDRPVSLFKSLHEARAWLANLAEAERRAARTPASPPETALPSDAKAERAGDTPWSDPQRQRTMIRHGRRRNVPASGGYRSYAGAR